MRTSDLDRFISLHTAFCLAGEAMFKTAWTGYEIDARPGVQGAKNIRQERRRIHDRLSIIRTELRQLKDEVRAEISSSERELVGDDARILHVERDELRVRLVELPDITESHVEDADRFTRRREVEGALCDAFSRGQIKLHYGHNGIVDWESWTQMPGFRLSFYMSFVCLPREMFTTRRAPAFVPLSEFQAWIARFGVGTDAPKELTLEALISEWLVQAFADDPGERTSKPRFCEDAAAAFEKRCDREFEKAFDIAWSDVAPDSRKRGGRKRKS